MREYLFKMKTYFDTFASIRHQILEENQILYILVGLGIEYDVVVSIVTLDLILTLWKMYEDYY